MEKAALLREIHVLEDKITSFKHKLRPHDCALLETQMRHRSLSRALQSGALAAAALQSLYAEFLVGNRCDIWIVKALILTRQCPDYATAEPSAELHPSYGRRGAEARDTCSA